MVHIITISIEDSIYTLVTKYPQIKDIMVEVGFKDIVKPGIVQTVGRMMNLRKGCAMKGMQIETLIEVFKAHGFDLR